MAWRYNDEDCLVRDMTDGDPLENRVVCWVNGAANHGPLLAMAQRMENVCREITSVYHIEGCSPGCNCFICECYAIARELDRARGKVGP